MTRMLDPQPVLLALYRVSRLGQGCKPVRCSSDPAKRRWYGEHRTRRLELHLSRNVIRAANA